MKITFNDTTISAVVRLSFARLLLADVKMQPDSLA